MPIKISHAPEYGITGVLTPDARVTIDLVANNPSAIAYVDRAVVALDRRARIALEITP